MEVQLSFKSKAQFSRFMRNYRNGKGTVISNKNVSLSMNGEGFGDVLKGVGKQLGKKVLNEVVKEGAKQIKKNVISKAPMGLNTIGNTLVDLASEQAQNKVKGMGLKVKTPYGFVGGIHSLPPKWRPKSGTGLFDTAKSLASKASKSKLANNLGKMAIAEGKKQLKQQLNSRTSGIANTIGNMVLNEASNQATGQLNAYSGGGYVDSLGGNGVQQSMQNITGSNARKVRKAVGGSFRMP